MVESNSGMGSKTNNMNDNELIGRYFQVSDSLAYCKDVYGFEVGEYLRLERIHDNRLYYWTKYCGSRYRIGTDLILMPKNFDPTIINNYLIY